jgi:hypothetical protein
MKRSIAGWCLVGAVVLAGLVGVTPAGAILNAYDSLAVASNGAATGPLNGATNGWGWKSVNGNIAWDVQNRMPGYQVVTTTPLTYTAGSRTLVTNGGYGVGGDSWTSAGRVLDTGSPSIPGSGSFVDYVKSFPDPPISRNMVGKEGTNIWASMLVRNDASDDYRAEFHAWDVAWSINTAPNYPGRAGVILNNGAWYLRVIDAAHNTNMVSTGVACSNGQTCLMVFNFKFDTAGDMVDLYVNPSSIGGNPPSVPTCSTTNSGDVYFLSFSFYPGSGPNRGAVDEIRLGDSFATVSPFVETRVWTGPLLIIR